MTHAVHIPIAEATEAFAWAGMILWLPLISLALCGVCAALRVRSKLPGWLSVGLLGNCENQFVSRRLLILGG